MQISDIIVFGSVVGEAQQQPILIVEEVKAVIPGDLGEDRGTIQVILGFGSVYRLAGPDAGIVVGVAGGQAAGAQGGQLTAILPGQHFTVIIQRIADLIIGNCGVITILCELVLPVAVTVTIGNGSGRIA